MSLRNHDAPAPAVTQFGQSNMKKFKIKPATVAVSLLLLVNSASDVAAQGIFPQ
jgi:hypothetical protein